MNVESGNFVIVIGRQCGSGGRELGKALASRLGIPYYDRTLLSEASRELGMRHELFERNDERRPSKLKSILGACYGSFNECYTGECFCDDDILRLQGSVIRRLMEKGPCVIVGRGADYVGRDLPNLLSIFLHAPIADRVRRVRSRECCSDISDSEIADLLMRKDRDRAEYYNYYTGRNWGDADNYHLCIDSSKAGIPAIVGLVCGYLEAQKAERKND